MFTCKSFCKAFKYKSQERIRSYMLCLYISLHILFHMSSYFHIDLQIACALKAAV